jgi:multidrug efflux system outer membrane protein
LFSYRYSIQNAFADVENSLVASQKLVEQQAAQEKLVAALQDYARLANLQFNGGYTSYTTVLQAEQSLFPAELQLASLRASVFSASVNLSKAMGGGWVVEADKMTGNTAPPPTERDTGMPPLF